MKHFAGIFFIVYAAAALTSCLPPYNADYDADGGLPGSNTPIIVSDLFVVPENGSEGTRRFYTNDSNYRSPSGFTLWTYTSEVINFQERTVIVRKPLGSTDAGYGVIICSVDRMVNNSLETIFLTVMINNNGRYAVGKVINGSYSHLINWADGKGLTRGIGLPHKIRIVKDSQNPNMFHLYFNDVFERSFTDEEAPLSGGVGRNGYIVVIAPEDLNNSSVEVWFNEVQ